MIAAVFTFRTPPGGMLDVPLIVVPVNIGFNIGANVPKVVASVVPFNVIAGVVIPPLAVKMPLNVELVNEANVVFNEVPFNLISGVINVVLTVRLFVVIPVVATIDEAPTIPVNVGPANGAYVVKFAKVAKVAKVVANDVPFKLIVGVDIPPCATNNPLICAIPSLINEPV